MNNANEQTHRLQKVLLNDRITAPDNLIGVLKSDVAGALSNFFELNPASVKLTISTDDFGMYVIRSEVKAFRVKNAGILSSDV